MIVYTINKTLTQLDPVYCNVTAYMSAQDKIDYCNRLIRDTEQYVDSCSRMLDEKVILKYKYIIEAAKRELNQLVES